MTAPQSIAAARVIEADDAAYNARRAWHSAGSPMDDCPEVRRMDNADAALRQEMADARGAGLCTTSSMVDYLRLRRDLARAERDGLGLAWVIREWGVTEAEAG